MFGELPAWGFYVRHAENISMKKIKLSYTGGEFRTACVFDDVAELNLNNIHIEKAASLPVIILNKVKNPVLQQLQLPDETKEMVLIK